MKTMETKEITSWSKIKEQKATLQSTGVFVLDHGRFEQIQYCSQSGLSVMVPNFLMDAKLILQTIVRLNRSVIVTSLEIWNKIKSTLENNPMITQKLSVLIFSES